MFTTKVFEQEEQRRAVPGVCRIAAFDDDALFVASDTVVHR